MMGTDQDRQKRKKRGRLLSILGLCLCLFWVCCGFAEVNKVGSLNKVAPIAARPEWDRFKILVWQYQTSVLRDIELYRRIGLGGFHIDRGQGRDNLVDFSIKESFPYYVDHAADKGFLHLKDSNVQAVTGKRSLATRPNSLADPEVLSRIKEQIEVMGSGLEK